MDVQQLARRILMLKITVGSVAEFRAWHWHFMPDLLDLLMPM